MEKETGFKGEAADFEAKKTKYFSAVAVKLKEAFRMHKAFGLLAKNEQGVKDWRNASEHQVVVAARTRALARLLGVSETTSDQLFLAAGVHDFYKRKTVEKTPKGVTMTMRQQIEAEQESAEQLAQAQFPQNILNYTGSIGSSPDAIDVVEAILKKGDNITEQELAALLLHYTDDYTIGSDWASAASLNNDGKKISNLNRRMDKSRENIKYEQVNNDDIRYFGEKSLDIQERVGEAVEQFLARKLSKLSATPIDPKDLPVIIDRQIKKEIAEVS